MPKVHISYVLSVEDVRSETLDVAGVSVLAPAPPATPNGELRVRIEVVSGAVHFLAGLTPVASASAGLRLAAGDDPVEWVLYAGARLAFIAAEEGATQVSKTQQQVTACVIGVGASLSGAIDLGVFRAVGLETPATFEPTSLTFHGSADGITYSNVYDSAGVEKVVTVGVSRRVVLSPSDFYGLRYLKVRGGTAASPMTVAAARTLQIIGEG